MISMEPGVIVLAAGQASRMGSPKQLLQWRGQTLLRRLLVEIQEAELPQTVVVTGAFQHAVRAEARALLTDVVHNADWQVGMGSSIQCGLRYLLQRYPGLSAVLILLVDQPLVDRKHIGAFLSAIQQHPDKLLAAGYHDTVGVPALLPRAFFPALMTMPADKGAKALFYRYRSDLQVLPCPQAAIDVDTPDDWEWLLRQYPNHS